MGELLQDRCQGERLTNSELILLEEHITRNCLCAIPDSTIKKFFYLLTELDGEKTHAVITSIHSLCILYMKQYSQGKVCPQVADIRHTFISLDNRLVDFLLNFDEDTLFVATCALALVLIITNIDINERWIDELIKNIKDSSQPSEIYFSLEVLKQIIEWKYNEEYNSELMAGTCHLSVEPVKFFSSELKYTCLKYLRSSWPQIVTKFHYFMESNSVSTEQTNCELFLRLWKSLVSVKTNLFFQETELFYDNLNSFLDVLDSDTPSIIWKSILDLLNEALCYGSTLSLQGNLDEKSCKLAQSIINGIREDQLLQKFSDRIIDVEDDTELLRKFVLLILKSIAVVVKESCGTSTLKEVHIDMEVIESQINEVINRLDRFVKTVKTQVPFLPESRLGEWIVQLFGDQNDYLIESMLCCLDVATILCYRKNALRDLHENLNPGITFLHFLQYVNLNVDSLLKFLISNETCFLGYFFQILKYLTKNFIEFKNTSSRYQLRDVHNLLNGLRRSIERLEEEELFPYDITPVVILLKQCEKKYTTLFIFRRGK